MKKDKKIKKHICIGCHHLFPENKIEYAPDPYASDVRNDKTKVWMCARCRYESSRDI